MHRVMDGCLLGWFATPLVSVDQATMQKRTSKAIHFLTFSISLLSFELCPIFPMKETSCCRALSSSCSHDLWIRLKRTSSWSEVNWGAAAAMMDWTFSDTDKLALLWKEFEFHLVICISTEQITRKIIDWKTFYKLLEQPLLKASETNPKQTAALRDEILIFKLYLYLDTN